MIYIKYKQQIYRTITIGMLVIFFLASCSSNNEDPITPIETAAVPSIVGEVIATDGTPIVAVTVDLDSFIELRAVTDINGKFNITPPSFDDYQLIVSKEGFVTQFRDIKVSDSGVLLTPIVLKQIDKVEQIDSAIGGEIEVETEIGTKVKVIIPPEASEESIEVSMSLLKGVEIPSTLPKEQGKTLLPIGTLVVGITPVDTVLTIAAEAIVPTPTILQEIDRTFDVYALNNGVWSLYRKNVRNNINNEIAFPVLKAGSYMVVSAIADITADPNSTKTSDILETSQLNPGDTTEKTVTDTIQISGLEGFPEKEKAEVIALITSLLEKQLETKFGVEHDLFLTAPNVAKTTKKLVCSTSLVQITQLSVFAFNIPLTGTTVSTSYSQICEDDGQPEPTGGVGGSS